MAIAFSCDGMFAKGVLFFKLCQFNLIGRFRSVQVDYII